MSDMISREAAIDALMVAIDNVGILDSDDVKVVLIICRPHSKKSYGAGTADGLIP